MNPEYVTGDEVERFHISRLGINKVIWSFIKNHFRGIC
jgi:hypothetical protein